jgi:hypothetical protein
MTTSITQEPRATKGDLQRTLRELDLVLSKIALLFKEARERRAQASPPCPTLPGTSRHA